MQGGGEPLVGEAPQAAGPAMWKKVAAGLTGVALVAVGVAVVVNSGDSTDPSALTCNVGDMREAKDCEGYSLCVAENKEESRDCARGYMFNTMTKQCDIGRNVLCGERRTGAITRKYPSCKAPVAPAGSHLVVSSCHNVQVGTTCHATCASGYEGVSELECKEEDADLAGELPQCAKIPCSSDIAGFNQLPVGVSLGKCDGLTFEDSCTLSCDESQGYVGEAKDVVCGASGMLVGAVPSCVLRDCPTPSIPGTRFVDGCDVAAGQSCTLVVEAGYRFGESSQQYELKCSEKGSEWINIKAAQEELHALECTLPESTSVLDMSACQAKGSMHTGDMCELQCAEGYVGNPGTMTCDGRAGDTQRAHASVHDSLCKPKPFCKVKGEWKEPAGLYVEPCLDKVYAGKQCEVRCEANWVPASEDKKSVKLTCDQPADAATTPHFEQDAGQDGMFGLGCKPLACTRPDSTGVAGLYDFSACSEQTIIDGKCVVKCNSDVGSGDDSEAQCVATSPTAARFESLPSCTPKPEMEFCGLPAEASGVQYDAGTCAHMKWGDKCELSCGLGYKATSSPASAKGECSHGKIAWEGKLPACEAAPCPPPAPEDLQGGVDVTECKDVRTGGTCVGRCMTAEFFQGADTTVSCTAEGRLVNMPKCKQMDFCTLSSALKKKLSAHPHVEADQCQNIYPGQDCLVGCGSGGFIGRAKLHCDAKGIVDGELPECSPRPCKAAKDWGPHVDTAKCADVIPGGDCMVTCAAGYESLNTWPQVDTPTKYTCDKKGQMAPSLRAAACEPANVKLTATVDLSVHKHVDRYVDSPCTSPGCSMKGDDYELPQLSSDMLLLTTKEGFKLNAGKETPRRVVVRRGGAFTVQVHGVSITKIVTTLSYPYLSGRTMKQAPLQYVRVADGILVVTLPADAPIGEQLLTVKFGSTVRTLGVVVLFNPFNPDCEEYLDPADFKAQLVAVNSGEGYRGIPVASNFDDLLEEYVMATEGTVWQGSAYGNGGRSWTYDHFSGSVLLISLNMLRSVVEEGKPTIPIVDVMRSPALVSRHMSSGISGRVCAGNWAAGDVADARRGAGVFAKALESNFKCAEVSVEQPEDGDKDPKLPATWFRRCRSPNDHSSSRNILEQAWVLRQLGFTGRVPFCQCWVFGSVLTAVSRAVGIAGRTVTTFASAHDTNEDRAITEFHWRNEKGQGGQIFSAGGACQGRVRSKCRSMPSKCLAFIKSDLEGSVPEGCEDYMICTVCSDHASDSVWNFHVWNEVYFRRAEDKLPSQNKWQVVDATPQESTPHRSPVMTRGSMACGPASIAEINDNKDGCFDQQFVIGETNSWAKPLVFDLPGDMTVSKDMTELGKASAFKLAEGRKALFGGRKYDMDPFGRDPLAAHANFRGESHGNSAGTNGYATFTRLAATPLYPAYALDVTFDYKKTEPSGPGGCTIDTDRKRMCGSGKGKTICQDKESDLARRLSMRETCPSVQDCDTDLAGAPAVHITPAKTALRVIPSEYTRVGLTLSQPPSATKEAVVTVSLSAEVVTYTGESVAEGGASMLNLRAGPTKRDATLKDHSSSSETLLSWKVIVPVGGNAEWHHDFILPEDELLTRGAMDGLGGVRLHVGAVVEGSNQYYSWSPVLTVDTATVKVLRDVEEAAAAVGFELSESLVHLEQRKVIESRRVRTAAGIVAAKRHMPAMMNAAPVAHATVVQSIVTRDIQGLAVALRLGGDANSSNAQGISALSLALAQQDQTAVSTLVAFGADVCADLASTAKPALAAFIAQVRAARC